MLIVVSILGSVGAGAYYYYKNTEEKIATLQKNNAKLEVAIETSEASVKALQKDIERFQELNSQLQSDLQKAEAYGDDLRQKLREHDLTSLALRKPNLLEGKMNGATAKLWREIMEDTGGDGSRGLPEWLQQRDTGTGGEGSNENNEAAGTNSRETETSSTR